MRISDWSSDVCSSDLKAVRRGQAAPLVPRASRRPGTADRPARPAGRGGGGMTGHSVEKIGGTSMAATATLFDNVLIGGRSGADLYNRVFVVSAYGGMTDLLLENKKSGAPGVYGRFVADDDAGGWREAMEDVRRAMQTRNAAMFARPESREEADAFVDTRIATVAACLEDLARLRAHGRLCVKEPLK